MARAADSLAWPTGDGAIAGSLRASARKHPTLGPVENWPASLRSAVQAALDSTLPTFIWWSSALLQFHNDAAVSLLPSGSSVSGSPAPDVHGTSTFWTAIGPNVVHVLETRQPATVHDVPLGPEGANGSVTTMFLSPLRGEDGTVAGVQGIAMPVATSARQTALDAGRAFALELSDALLGITDPIEVQATATRLLGEWLQADRVYYLEINEERGQLLVERDFVGGDAPSLVGRYALADFPWISSELRGGETFVIEDSRSTSLLSDADRPALESITVRAFVVTPLITDGELVAALCVTTTAPRIWRSSDIALIEATAERTWAAVEQARAEEQLRRSEEKYRSLFNSIDEGFCIIEVIFDDDGKPQDYRFLEVNPAFEQHTTMKNATGRTMKEIIPEHESDWFDIYGHIALTGEPMRFVNEAAALDDRWFELNAFRIGDPELRHVAVLFTDITERTRTESTLRENEALFRSFTEASADTLWIVEASTRQLEYLSPAFDRTFGEPRDRVMENIERWFELVHEEDRNRVVDSLSRALAGETHVSEYRIVRPSDQAVRWIRDTVFPIESSDGHVTRAAGIAQDVTEQKRAEEEREDFIDAAAHDLKTPITSLRGQAQLLLRRARRDQVVSLDILEPRLVEIDRAAMRMVRVIDEMLDAAHLRTERALDLRLGSADLVELTKAALEDASRTTNRHTLYLDAREPSVVGVWDAVRLGRVMANLLGNAIKFSPEGGEVIVTIGRDKDQAVLSVADHGIGIPASDMPRLFQRFRRGGNVTRIPGTGLGLAGARQIVEQHGGTLTVTSEEGRGSVFEMRLPLQPVAGQDHPAGI